ncbi:MAG TPA: hypothetical protein VMM56_11410 [Planctomycetaceae bacterium]|nr:hypothetical protein [Planctomycetaceae bacterium]
MKSARRIKSSSVFKRWRDLLFLTFTTGYLLSLSPPLLLNAEEDQISQASATPEESGPYLLERLQASRAKLKSGVFQAHRVVTRKPTAREEQDQAGPYLEEKIFCAFDFEQDLLRFDTERSGENALLNQVFRYFTTRTEAWHFMSGRNGNMLKKILPHGHLQFRGEFHPFDIRLVGICNRTEFQQVSSYEKLVEFYTKECTATGKLLEDKKYLLTLSHNAGKAQIRREIILDASRDFVPVQFDSRYLSSESEGWRSLHPSITVEWKKSERSNAFVPAKLIFPEETADDEITFECKSVNQPLDQKWFTLVDLKIPHGTEIIDASIPVNPVLEQP